MNSTNQWKIYMQVKGNYELLKYLVFDFCQPIWIALLWVTYRDITTDRMKWTQSSFEIFPLLFFGVPFPNKTMVQQFVSMTNILYFNTWQWKHRHCWTFEVKKKYKGYNLKSFIDSIYLIVLYLGVVLVIKLIMFDICTA